MGDFPDKSKRIPAHAEVRINNAYLAESMDIREEGMYVFCPQTFVLDSVVDLDVTVGGDTTSLKGKVIQVQPGVGFGLSFPDLPEEVQGLFREVLKSVIEDTD